MHWANARNEALAIEKIKVSFNSFENVKLIDNIRTLILQIETVVIWSVIRANFNRL